MFLTSSLYVQQGNSEVFMESFPGWSNQVISHFSHRSGTTLTGPPPFWAEEPRAGCSTGVSQKSSKKEEIHLHRPAAYCSLVFLSNFHSSASPSPFPKGCSQPLQTQACFDTEGCPDPDAAHCMIWFTWVHLSPLEWHPVPQVCHLNHCTWCHLRTGWGCTQSNSVSVMKTWKKYSSKYEPLKDTTCHWPPSEYWAIDH